MRKGKAFAGPGTRALCHFGKTCDGLRAETGKE